MAAREGPRRPEFVREKLEFRKDFDALSVVLFLSYNTTFEQILEFDKALHCQSTWFAMPFERNCSADAIRSGF